MGHYAIERPDAEPDDTVVALGCEAVGLGAIVSLAHRGDSITVDINDRNVDKAHRCGARGSINLRMDRLRDGLHEHTSGEDPDVVEAVGRPETFVSAVEELAFAGRVIYIGYVLQTLEYDTAL